MSVIDKLNKMHRDAVEQIRAGEDNEFLVGFLTTATMLELSNLMTSDLDLDRYAQAIVDVITQYAPIDRCRVQFDLRGFSTVVAASGAIPRSMPTTSFSRAAAKTFIGFGGISAGARKAVKTSAAGGLARQSSRRRVTSIASSA